MAAAEIGIIGANKTQSVAIKLDFLDRSPECNPAYSDETAFDNDLFAAPPLAYPVNVECADQPKSVESAEYGYGPPPKSKNRNLRNYRYSNEQAVKGEGGAIAETLMRCNDERSAFVCASAIGSRLCE